MNYLYYKLWYSFKKVPTNDTPATNAMILLSVLEGINIITLLGWINHYIKIQFFYLSKHEIIIFSSILCILLYIVNYFHLYKKRDSIAEKYIKESGRRKIAGTVFLYSYIVGSFVLAYVMSKVFPI